tara:strand:- start:532 stop:693 length:162 start_codon:yes stop_codon:yes gene_type:complete
MSAEISFKAIKIAKKMYMLKKVKGGFMMRGGLVLMMMQFVGCCAPFGLLGGLS